MLIEENGVNRLCILKVHEYNYSVECSFHFMSCNKHACMLYNNMLCLSIAATVHMGKAQETLGNSVVYTKYCLYHTQLILMK